MRIVFSLLLLTACLTSQTLPDGFSLTTMAPGAFYEFPVALETTSDGRIFVAEKVGRVRIIQHDSLLTTPFLDISVEVLSHQDRGLLGMALAPDFDNSGYIYLLYAVDYEDSTDQRRTDAFGRLVRYTADALNPNVADTTSRHILLGDSFSTGIPACYFSHAPDALVFGSDGMLLVSAGDGASFNEVDAGGLYPECFGQPEKLDTLQDVGAFRSQYLGSMAAKILRIDPETGAGLPSNPFFDGDPHSNQSRVWAYGLRNPYRFTIDDSGSPFPEDGNPGTIYAGDVGWLGWEEINVVRGGENFGWPCFEGVYPHPEYAVAEPLHSGCSDSLDHMPPEFYFSRAHPDSSWPTGLLGRSIIMGDIYKGSIYPPEWQNNLFYTDFIETWLAMATRDENGNLLTQALISPDFGNISDIHYSRFDEHFYFVDLIKNEVLRLDNDSPATIDTDRPDATPGSFALLGHFPNPFNATIKIEYELYTPGQVQIKMFDVAGRQVALLKDAFLPPGQHEVSWNVSEYSAHELSSGTYIYRITVGQHSTSAKVILIK